jgi:thymidine kinase
LPGIYKPGFLEAIFGPMKSGKSQYLIRLFTELTFSNIEGIVFKPAVNTREIGIVSRGDNKQLKAIVIDEKCPENILDELKKVDNKFIGIDEAQFFSDSLVWVVDELLRKDYHVVICGLLLSFRGEPFGPMPYLVGRANKIIRLTAVCEYPECNNWAVLTQRLIEGEPAQYDSPLVLIENSGQQEKYEPRCIHHHLVLGKPSSLK